MASPCVPSRWQPRARTGVGRWRVRAAESGPAAARWEHIPLLAADQAPRDPTAVPRVQPAPLGQPPAHRQPGGHGRRRAAEPRFWCGWRGHDPSTRQQLRRTRAGPEARALYEGIRDDGTVAGHGFGADVRWPELDRLIAVLGSRRHRPSGMPAPERYPGRPEHERLRAFLPGLRYVHLTREDTSSQALAWWWSRHARDRVELDPRQALGGGPNGVAVDDLERRLRAEEWRWVSYFARAGVEPLVVSYEALTEDHAPTVRRILGFLGVPGADGIVVPRPPGGAVDLEAARQRRVRCGDAPGLRVSVVITGGHAAGDLAAVVEQARGGVDRDVEVVVVDDRPVPAAGDASSTGATGTHVVPSPVPAGLAAARNLGAARASGDVLVFLDAAARPRPGWLDPLLEVLARRSVAMAGPAIWPPAGDGRPVFGLTWADPLLRTRWLEHPPVVPVPVPFVPACCMAVRRRDLESVGGFDTGMTSGDAGAAELCLQLWRRGRACLVVPASKVTWNRPDTTGPGQLTASQLHDALRLATMHLGPDALLRTFREATGEPAFPEVYACLVNSDVFERRRRIVAASTRDATWFLDRFHIDAVRPGRAGHSLQLGRAR